METQLTAVYLIIKATRSARPFPRVRHQLIDEVCRPGLVCVFQRRVDMGGYRVLESGEGQKDEKEREGGWGSY